MALTRLPSFTLLNTDSFTFGNANITGNIAAGNVTVTANLTAGNVKTDHLLYSNGSPYVFTTSAAGSNTQLQFNDGGSFAGSANLTFDKTTNTLSVTALAVSGNVTAGNLITSGTGGNISGANVVTANLFSGNGSSLTSITGANVTGQVGYAAVANSVAVANVSGIGNIATINKDGNASNILYGNGVFASAPVTYGNSNVATYLASFGSNSISTTGNITAGNLTVGGNLTVNGTLTSINSTIVQIDDLAIVLANDASSSSQANGAGIIINGANANMLYINASNAFVFTHKISADGSLLSNIAGANVTGFVPNANVANTAYSVNGANISGQVANALVAGTVYTNAQPNITSVGTLTSLNVTGNVTAGNLITSGTGGNISGANVVTANLFVGNGSSLSTITGANVTGQVGYAAVANSVAAANVSGLGNLALLNKDGNASNILYGNGSFASAPVTYSDSNVATFLASFGSNSISTTGNITAGNLSASGNITANNFTTSGSGGNITGANNITASGNITANNFVTSGSGGNITGANNITASGNITANNFVTSGTGGNITGANNITANFFIGNGSLLTGLPSGYTDSNVATYLPAYTGNLNPANLVVSNHTSLGAIGNITITGGSADYVLKTDGAGNLSWTAMTASSSTTTSVTVDTFTGDGSNTTFTLSATPSDANYVTVNYGGIILTKDTYTVSTNSITFDTAPASGAKVEISTLTSTTTGGGGSSGGSSGGGSSLTWSIISANTTASANTGYFVNTTSGEIALTLPSSPTLGTIVRVNDLAGTFATHACRLKGNGNKIQGLTADFLLDYDQAGLGLVFSNSTYGWKIMEL